MKRFGLLLAGLTVCFAGCSHGATSALPTTPALKQNAQATFVMHWPPPKPNKIHPHYVSPSTQSVSILVNSNSQPVVVNNPGTGIPTSIPIDAPVGTDVFTFKAFSQQNAQGDVLSQAQVSKLIVAGTSNNVSATLDGVVASAALSLSNASPPAGIPTALTLTVTAADAAGNTIIGPGGYCNPIHLSDSDSFATSLSATEIIGPGAPVTLTYNGKSIWSATISGSASGVPAASIAPASFAPAIAFFLYPILTANAQPRSLVGGPDGAVWFTENLTGKIGRIDTSGNMTEYPATTPNPLDITAGPDGALWFTDGTNNKIGRMTTAGNATLYSVLTANGYPDGIVAGPDGQLWFTEYQSGLVGRMTVFGSMVEFNAYPSVTKIAPGPDGALWITVANTTQNIIRMTTTGIVSAPFTIPIPANSTPVDIVGGSDARALGRLEAVQGNLSSLLEVITSDLPRSPTAKGLLR